MSSSRSCHHPLYQLCQRDGCQVSDDDNDRRLLAAYYPYQIPLALPSRLPSLTSLMSHPTPMRAIQKDVAARAMLMRYFEDRIVAVRRTLSGIVIIQKSRKEIVHIGHQ